MTDDRDRQPPPAPSTAARWARRAALALGLALLAAIAALALFVDADRKAALVARASRAVDANIGAARSPGGRLAYCAVLALWCTAMLPSTPVEVVAGFLYGLPWGFALAVAGKLTGNIFSVLLARCVLRGWIERTVLPRSPLLRAVASAASENGFRAALLVRASMVPLSVKNYGLGVLPIRLVDIAKASLICGPSFALQHVYVGSAASSILEATSSGKPQKPLWLVLVTVSVTLGAMVYFAVVVRRKLRDMTAAAEKGD